MTLLDGKLTSSKVKAEIAAKIASDVAGGKRAPGLAVILVGENPASQVYVRNKIKDCKEIGIISKPFILPENTPEDELISLVKRLNGDKTVDGILVQLPLPKSIDERKVIETISPSKDVDAFHPANVGRITLGLNGFAPCTPAGIRHKHRRQKLRCCRQKQHRRQADGTASPRAKRHRNDLPFKNARPRPPYQKCRYSCCSRRQSKNDHRGYDKGRCDRRRCRHESR